MAAGISSRLGRPKQLLPVGGRTLLVHVLITVLSGPLAPVVVVLGNEAEKVRASLDSSQDLVAESEGRLIVVVNPDYASGQAGSIRVGLDALPTDCPAAVFIMGDEVGLRVEVLDRLTQVWSPGGPERVIQPRYGGRPSGPVLWPRSLFPALRGLSGDTGGRSILATQTVAYLDLSAEYRPWDIDTEDDYRDWVSRTVLF